MGLFCAIMGSLNSLKHKRKMDQYCPLISDEFLAQAEELIRKIGSLEKQLAEASEPTEKERLQEQYEKASRQLQELIDPPSDEDEEEDEE